MPRRARKDMPRVQRFVHEYVWGKHAGHVTKAALAAGFGQGKNPELHEQSASNYGCQLLRRPDIKAKVDAEFAQKEAMFKAKAVRVAEECYLQATARIADALDDDGNLLPKKLWPEELRAAVVSLEVDLAPPRSGTADDGEYECKGIGIVAKLKAESKRASQELFLKWAGKLKDVVQHEGLTLEELALAADKKLRAQRAAAE